MHKINGLPLTLWRGLSLFVHWVFRYFSYDRLQFHAFFLQLTKITLGLGEQLLTMKDYISTFPVHIHALMILYLMINQTNHKFLKNRINPTFESPINWQLK